jgi:hypothetical protein
MTLIRPPLLAHVSNVRRNLVFKSEERREESSTQCENKQAFAAQVRIPLARKARPRVIPRGNGGDTAC